MLLEKLKMMPVIIGSVFFLPSLSEGGPTAAPVVREIAKIGDASLGVGFLSSKEEQTFLVMVALWVIREAWAFFKEKANKTGEKVAHIDKRIESMEQKLDLFIRAAERSEERMEKRLDRIEGHGVTKR